MAHIELALTRDQIHKSIGPEKPGTPDMKKKERTDLRLLLLGPAFLSDLRRLQPVRFMTDEMQEEIDRLKKAAEEAIRNRRQAEDQTRGQSGSNGGNDAGNSSNNNQGGTNDSSSSAK